MVTDAVTSATQTTGRPVGRRLAVQAPATPVRPRRQEVAGTPAGPGVVVPLVEAEGPAQVVTPTKVPAAARPDATVVPAKVGPAGQTLTRPEEGVRGRVQEGEPPVAVPPRQVAR